MSDDLLSILNSTSKMNGIITSATTSQAKKADEQGGLGKDAFMKLLLEQMKAQDPMSPMNGTDFFAQLAQFSLLEQMWKMNDSLTSMQKQQQLTQGSALIGRTVDLTADDGTLVSGVVDGVRVTDGNVLVTVAGSQYPLDSIVSVNE